MKALVTGSGGLIGSQCVRLLARHGWTVVGIDNDMRSQFFGRKGTTRPVVEELMSTNRQYRHFDADIRDRLIIREIFAQERPDSKPERRQHLQWPRLVRSIRHHHSLPSPVGLAL